MSDALTYVYESGNSELPKIAFTIILSNDIDIQLIDATEWDDGKRQDYYNSQLIPRSVRQGKRLRGRIRAHRSNKVSFTGGLLLIGGPASGDFFTGTEAVYELQSLSE